MLVKLLIFVIYIYNDMMMLIRCWIHWWNIYLLFLYENLTPSAWKCCLLTWVTCRWSRLVEV